jgi:phage antirepressor YoqD-like protein
MTYVTESGMYDVVLRSDSIKAKPFRKWVTSEVLPAIRKTGGYITTTQEDTPETIMARALLIADSTIKQQSAQLKEQAPKVLFAEAVETSSRSCLIAELAKIITQNGVKVGQNRLFEWMRNNGFLCKSGDYYNQPTQKAMEMGLFEIKKTTIVKPDGTTLVNTTPKVTGKGQIFFVNRFLYNKAREGK